MSAKTLDIADALAAALTAATFTASRDYLTRGEVKDLAARRITVLPRGDTRRASAREADEQTHTISIVYQKQIDQTKNTTIDAALAEVEQIKALWGENGSLRHTAFAGAHWTGTLENDPLCDPDHLDQHSLVTARLTLTFSLIE